METNASCLYQHSADLGETAGVLPDREPSTEHLSPGVSVRGWMGGQRDRTQGDQVWIPEGFSKEHILKYKTSNPEQTRHAMSRKVFPCAFCTAPGITWLPPRRQQDEIIVFPRFADRWRGHAIEGVFLIHLHDGLTLPALEKNDPTHPLSGFHCVTQNLCLNHTTTNL